MSIVRLTAILGGILLLFALTSCIDLSNPEYEAPGCTKSINWLPNALSAGYSTCNGKSIIVKESLEILPEIPCMSVNVNNCKNGIINLVNRCPCDIIIGNVNISSECYDFNHDGNLTCINGNGIELILLGNGSTTANKVDGIYSNYTVEENLRLSINGTVGNRTFTISYVKTRPLC